MASKVFRAEVKILCEPGPGLSVLCVPKVKNGD